MLTTILEVNEFSPDEKALLTAADIIKNGGLVAFPTETVYGLGADATDQNAAKKIYQAKGRPSDNPLIISWSYSRFVSFDVCNEYLVVLFCTKAHIVRSLLPTVFVFSNISFCDSLVFRVFDTEALFVEATKLSKLVKVLTTCTLEIPFANWFALTIRYPF